MKGSQCSHEGVGEGFGDHCTPDKSSEFRNWAMTWGKTDLFGNQFELPKLIPNQTMVIGEFVSH